MDNIIQSDNILLHSCCGPCAEWPAQVLSQEGYQLTLYYGNPNIHPTMEWERRKDALKKFADLKNLPLHIEPRFEQAYWESEAWKDTYSSRCEMCYAMRMDMAATTAAQMGFSAFTTTLLVSIYQDHEAIIKAAQRAAEKHNVQFLYRDFREGFRKGQDMAREDGLYRQKFCGCIFSLEESKFKDKIYRSFEGSDG